MGSSSKGSAFERQVAKFLTKWMSGQDRDFWLWRTAGSGSIATRTKGNASMAGDIRAVVPAAQWFSDFWAIEAKKGYPSASFDCHLKGNKVDPFKLFWHQCCTQASSSRRHPMLIVSRTRTPTWVGLDEQGARLFGHARRAHQVIYWDAVDSLPPMWCFDFHNIFSLNAAEDVKQKTLEIAPQGPCVSSVLT